MTSVDQNDVDNFKQIQVEPFADFSSLDSRDRPRADEPPMIAARRAQGGALLSSSVAIVQVSLFSSVHVAGGMPNLLLVTLVAVALLRGSIFGAVGGFFGGLLLDTATLETLGLTSLILTVAGYWIGRYGETTGRDRTHAPYVSVAVVTVLYAVGVARAATSCSAIRSRAGGCWSTRSSRRSRSTSS